MFLHPENQELLWNILQKSPYLVEFAQKFTGYREEWFRSIVEQFYTQWISQNRRVPENAQELLEINKRAIQMMVTDLKRLLGFSDSPSSSSQPSQQNNISSPYNVAEERKRRENSVSETYYQYQSEYNKLLERPALPIKELPQASADEKIKNIEELVKEHARMRDLDLAIHQSASSPKQPQNNQMLSSTKIKIMDEIDNIDIFAINEHQTVGVRTLTDQDLYSQINNTGSKMETEEGKKKQVHWGESDDQQKIYSK